MIMGQGEAGREGGGGRERVGEREPGGGGGYNVGGRERKEVIGTKREGEGGREK